MAGFLLWSKTAASNASSDPTINFAEGQSPSSLNDSARAVMARLAEYRDDVSGLLVTGGTSTAYTLTSNEGVASTPSDGQKIAFRPHATNGVAATLAVDGGTAYPIQTAPGAGVADSILTLGAPYTVVFRAASSAWILFDYYGTSSGISYTNVFSFMTGAEITNIIARTGSIDVTSKVQNAVNSLTAGTVFFPPGVYLFGNVTLKPGVEILGSGRQSTYIKAPANNAHIFDYVAAATVSDFNISCMSFDSNGFTGVRAISIDGTDGAKRCAYVNIEDCFFSNVDKAVYRRYCANSFLTNLHVIGGVDGFWQDTCADSDMVNLRSQLQSGTGFRIIKSSLVSAHDDEGTRMTNCSTNGTAIGFFSSGANWGLMTNCSFTTCSGVACAVFASCGSWKWNGGDAASANGTAGITIDSGCSLIRLSGLNIELNTFGITFAGVEHGATGCNFISNTNSDATVNAGFTILMGNICDSSGSSGFSLVETGGNKNIITNNITRLPCAVFGANSIANNNVLF